MRNLPLFPFSLSTNLVLNTALALGTALGTVFALGCADAKKSEGQGSQAQGRAGHTLPSLASSVAAKVIQVEGSSTVFPIVATAGRLFSTSSAKVVAVKSGTRRGIKKLCRGEVAIAAASRPIDSSEIDACWTAGIEFVELPIAFDGIAVVVNREVDWVDYLSVEELEAIWAPEAEGKLRWWSDVRANWPHKALTLLAHQKNSGTFDYFTQAIVGVEHSSRRDFTKEKDMESLLREVGAQRGALSFLAFAYYTQNKDKLRLVPVLDRGQQDGPVAVTPSPETIATGRYQPLSRPLFLYVAKRAVKREEVARFVNFFLDTASSIVTEVGFVPLPPALYSLVKKRFADGRVGSMFEGRSAIGSSLKVMLSR